MTWTYFFMRFTHIIKIVIYILVLCLFSLHLQTHPQTVADTLFANTTSSSAFFFSENSVIERSGIGGLALRSVLTGKHRQFLRNTSFWPPAISLLPISHHSPTTVYLIPTISIRLPWCFQPNVYESDLKAKTQTQNKARAPHKRSVVPGLKNATFTPHGGKESCHRTYPRMPCCVRVCPAVPGAWRNHVRLV